MMHGTSAERVDYGAEPRLPQPGSVARGGIPSRSRPWHTEDTVLPRFGSGDTFQRLLSGVPDLGIAVGQQRGQCRQGVLGGSPQLAERRGGPLPYDRLIVGQLVDQAGHGGSPRPQQRLTRRCGDHLPLSGERLILRGNGLEL